MSTVGLSCWRLGVWIGTAAALLYVCGLLVEPGRVIAQAPSEGDEAVAEAPPRPVPAASAATPRVEPTMNLWRLALSGGFFMLPILGMSLLAGTFVIERFIGLRRSRVLPQPLIDGLGQMAERQASFDPRRAYRLCQEFPSAAASVVRAMLLKVGRPVAEIEHAVAQASQREADRLYAHVRWLNISASLATMLGLIGTIQGMIMAFHQLTTLDPGTDRTQVLAAGIYTALVTTFAGLCVAIPAAFFSHYFEGRIQSAFREIDELVFSLIPPLERFEGRLRFGRQSPDAEPPIERPAAAPAARE